MGTRERTTPRGERTAEARKRAATRRVGQSYTCRQAAGGSVLSREPKRKPRKPGRKRGSKYGRRFQRTKPSTVDEAKAAPLPERCDCGGCVQWERTEEQYQEDIECRTVTRRFDIAIGRCQACRKRVQGRRPEQTSDAGSGGGANRSAGSGAGGADDQADGPVARQCATEADSRLRAHGESQHIVPGVVADVRQSRTHLRRRIEAGAK